MSADVGFAATTTNLRLIAVSALAGGIVALLAGAALVARSRRRD